MASKKGRSRACSTIFHPYPWAKCDFWTTLLTKAILAEPGGAGAGAGIGLECLCGGEFSYITVKVNGTPPLLDFIEHEVQAFAVEWFDQLRSKLYGPS